MLEVTNAYRQVHLLYSAYVCDSATLEGHKCLSASTFTVPFRTWKEGFNNGVTNAYRQVHLLYAAKKEYWDMKKSRHKCLSASTFTVPGEASRTPHTPESQMPIGKYIYCTSPTATKSPGEQSHKCLSASTFTVLRVNRGKRLAP